MIKNSHSLQIEIDRAESEGRFLNDSSRICFLMCSGEVADCIGNLKRWMSAKKFYR